MQVQQVIKLASPCNPKHIWALHFCCAVMQSNLEQVATLHERCRLWFKSMGCTPSKAGRIADALLSSAMNLWRGGR